MQMRIEAHSKLGNEIAVMEKVATFFRELQFSSSRIEEIKTVVSELVLNAMEHGNLFNKTKNVIITIKEMDEVFLLEVEDFGKGIDVDFDIFKNRDYAVNKTGKRGLGLFFVSQFSNSISSEIKNKKHLLSVMLSR